MTPEEKQNICDNIFNYISKELYGWMDNQIFVKETMEELGELSGRFNYELACDLGKRIPRVYIEGGRITATKDYYDDYR